jgi:hypothetical protein
MYKGPIRQHTSPQPTSNEFPTPTAVCRWLYDTISPVIRPRVMLAPCSGDSRLTEPWRAADSALTVHSYELRHGTDFFEAPAHPDADLCVVNPPFAWG